MITRIAKISFPNEQAWGQTYTAVTSVENGVLTASRGLVGGRVNSWRDARTDSFRVFQQINGAYVSYVHRLTWAARLTAAIMGDYFDPEHCSHVKTEFATSPSGAACLSVCSTLPTSNVRIADREPILKSYDFVSTTELAGAALYTVFSAVVGGGPGAISAVRCFDHAQRPLAQSYQQ